MLFLSSRICQGGRALLMEVFLAWSYEYMKNKEAEGVVGFNGRKRRKVKLLKDRQQTSFFLFFPVFW